LTPAMLCRAVNAAIM